MTIKSVISRLEELFEIFNDRFFESELQKPVITVSPDHTHKNVLGWCTSREVWHDTTTKDKRFELNICAEHLNLGIEEVAETLLHEMVHLFCSQNNIKDTSRGGTYHNKRFKEAAESHGLVCGSNSKYGWCITLLNDTARQEVNEYSELTDTKSFEIFREGESYKPKKKGGGKSSSRKYVCPVCGTIIRATKEVRVICADCNELMIQED